MNCFQLFSVYLLFFCAVFPFSFISLRHFFRYAHAYWQGRGNLIQFPPVALARSVFGPYVPTVTKISTDPREKADCKKSIPNSAGQNGPSVNFKDNLFPAPILS